MGKPDYSGYLDCCQQEIDGKRRISHRKKDAHSSRNHDVRFKRKRKGHFGRKLLIALLILKICIWLSQEGYIVTENGFVRIENAKKTTAVSSPITAIVF